MSSDVNRCWAMALVLVLAAASQPVLAVEDTVADPRAVIKAAKRLGTREDQARALIALAWPDENPPEPIVRSLARQELIYYGMHALPQLREAVASVDPIYAADVTATLVEAYRTHQTKAPPDYQPGLEEALWTESVEAKRQAMHQFLRRPYPPALLPMIDAVETHPDIGVVGIRAIGNSRDKRARFFLGEVLSLGHPRFQRAAAAALARLGDAGIIALRAGMGADRADIREASALGFVQVATVDDLTLLHEYVIMRGDDDPEVQEVVRARAMELEIALEEKQLSESASGEFE